MKQLLCILSLLFSLNTFSQDAKQHIREGNKQYHEKKYEEANSSYKKALDNEVTSSKAEFNLGDALYKQKKFAEAIEHFQKFADKTDDKQAKANAYHNIGNANLESQKYKESIEAYKKALRENPSDNDTR